ncbi:hypothetical protein [Natranaerofaba carboxydovora]|uniref:hypothetical protein n=1 Tax=Natranaerofaba carboxydovora TaxID=2742683 RepID=UPI001F132E4F|nr:hypothetical protein [Natranaerofaba carboxydovora]UMZ73856.1 Methyl-accepting chemotaxis protein (MCP) signaling domain protein [Natranaerofaba carboxydovora]
MPDKPEALEKEIKTNLGYLVEISENLISKTDNYYSIVHETLPEIEKNIDLTNQETEILIDYFVDSQDVDDLKDASLDSFFVSRVLKEIKEEFEKVSDLLINKSEIDEILSNFSAIKDGEKTSFDNFLELLKEMENILLKVKEISYNSIIFSARLGTEGKGFNVISDNLRETSSTLEKNINNINSSTDELIKWHGDFKEKINDITKKRERAVEEHSEDLDENLIIILKSMKSISELLKDLIQNVKNATEPFQELMTFIQRQDIIRQNLENLIKCLHVLERKFDELQYLITEDTDDEHHKTNNELYDAENYNEIENQDHDYGEDDDDEYNKEKQDGHQEDKQKKEDRILDLITFLDRGIDLLSQLGENVKTQLENSLNDIINTSENLVENLYEVKNDSNQLSEFLASEPSSQANEDVENKEREASSAVGHTFKELTESMDDFIHLLKEVKGDVNDLIDQKNSFDVNIDNLSEGLERVYKQVNFLKKVKLLSNIEVSRLDNQGKLVGDRINTIVELIQTKVNDNKNAFEKLKADLNNDLDKFDELVIENQNTINNSLEDVENSAKKVKTAKDAISSAVITLSQEVENLYNKTQVINEELKSADDIFRFTKMLTDYSKEVSNKVKAEKKRIMDYYNITEWEESDNELVSFFDQFTTYLERAKAKQFLSKNESVDDSEDSDVEDDSEQYNDIDEGSEEGELTLF